MKNNILQDLYYGRVAPSEMAFRKESEYANALAEAVRLGNQIRELLPDNQIDLVSRMESAQNQCLCEAEEDKFILGFQLGAKVMLSILLGENSTFEAM